ncbi:MAG: FAD-dependent oxidoreductase [Fimbriimonadaceae bacterium]|nr:FAD-dependent oxidoreductase [Chitinophagales bacterium]
MRRRRFVKSMGVTIPATIISSSFLTKITAQNTVTGNVIIIGAGAAGLYAAKVLKDAGVNITILEASAIHGGRIKPLNGFGDFPIEVGAEEVHGKGNVMGDPPSFLWNSINEYDPDLLIEYEDLGYKEIFALDDDYIIYPPEWDPDFVDAVNFIDMMYAYTGDDIIMNDYLADEFGIVEGDRSWHVYEAWIGAEYGDSIKSYGMKSMAVSENLWLTGAKNYALDDAYLNILDTLWFNSVLENIEYNKQVTSIDYSSALINISCADGSTYSSDKIICAVPLSVLKENVITFSPVLPALNQNAIDILQMGHGMKIILKFTEAFWGDNVYDITFKNYPTLAWSPGLIRTDTTNNILMCFTMGERAEYLSGLGDDAIPAILAELDSLFDGVATPAYVDAYIQDWIKEPFIKGSYSYPAPNTYNSETDSRRLDLATPIDCKIFFAGEATNNHHPSTVHGALESGARAAAEFLECLSVPVNETHIDNAIEVEMFTANNIATFNLNTPKIARAKMYLQSIDGKMMQQFYYDTIPSGENMYQFQIKEIAKGNYILCCEVDEKMVSEKVIL